VDDGKLVEPREKGTYLLKASGVEGKAFEAEEKRKRAGRKVDSKGAEGQFEALTKVIGATPLNEYQEYIEKDRHSSDDSRRCSLRNRQSRTQ